MNYNYRYFVTLSLFFSVAQASFMDNYWLSKAYNSYQKQDYNTTISNLKEIDSISLQSQLISADTYYRQGAYQKAIGRYQSIQSTSPKIKQHLYYNIANAYVKLSQYTKAKEYYVKVLQLGDDADAEYNLKLIAFREDKKDKESTAPHPKSQNSSSGKSQKESKKKSKKSKDSSSSSSGGDGKRSKEKNVKKGKIMSSKKEEKHPLGSKVYELINEGYIYEKQPW